MIMGTGVKSKSTIANENISSLNIDTTRFGRFGAAKAVIKELYKIDGGLKVSNRVQLQFNLY